MALKKSQLYASLWQSCDELRGGMDASQYKDYILTLLFMKYVSDKAKNDPYALITAPEGRKFLGYGGTDREHKENKIMHEVNLLAVLAAGIVPMIVGALWYGPLFGKRWLELMETTAEEIQDGFKPLKTYGVSFLLALVTAFILAQLFTGMGEAARIVSITGRSGNALVGVYLALMVLIGFIPPGRLPVGRL